MRILSLFSAILLTALINANAYAWWGAPSAEKFVTKASNSNLFEIESSNMALQKSSNPKVKDFARRLINDHKETGKQLKAAVKKANLSENLIATKLNDKYLKKLDKLREKTGEDFDNSYFEIQEDTHEKAIKLFEKYAEKGENPHLKAFATTALPALKQHKEIADDLE